MCVCALAYLFWQIICDSRDTVRIAKPQTFKSYASAEFLLSVVSKLWSRNKPSPRLVSHIRGGAVFISNEASAHVSIVCVRVSVSVNALHKYFVAQIFIMFKWHAHTRQNDGIIVSTFALPFFYQTNTDQHSLIHSHTYLLRHWSFTIGFIATASKSFGSALNKV